MPFDGLVWCCIVVYSMLLFDGVVYDCVLLCSICYIVVLYYNVSQHDVFDVWVCCMCVRWCVLCYVYVIYDHI